MRLSRSARNKWLATCLFSATILTGFQLQQMTVQATETQNAASVASVTPGSSSVATLKSSTSVPATSPDPQSAPATTTAVNDSTQPSAPSTETTAPTAAQEQLSQNSGESTDNTDQVGHLVVNAFNRVTNTPINNGAFSSELQGAAGSPIKDKSALVKNIPGYSFAGNVDSAIPDNYPKDTRIANLYYKPLSPIVVRYVDVTDPAKILWTYSLPTNYATKGQLYTTDTNLISFAGYTIDHVSGDTTGIITQTAQSSSVPNTQVVTYYYRPEPGQTSTLDTSNWVVTSKTAPIGQTGKYSFSIFVQRDQLPAMKLGGYGEQSFGTGQGKPNSGQSNTTGTGTDINNTSTAPSTTAVIAPSPVAMPTATVNIVTETGSLLSQLTISGPLGISLRPQIQQTLNQLRRNGFAILSNDVKGNSQLNDNHLTLNVKVSQPVRQSNPFNRRTMPVVAQLGAASLPVRQAANSTTDSTENSRTNQDSEKAAQTNQNNGQNSRQKIGQSYTTEATSKDSQRNNQSPREAIANIGQSFQHGASDTGSGGNQLTGLAAYFISLSGKINLGTKV
ncbi:hypothetical protein [Secundilactobacillus mixtipabuli]|uniref:Cell surface protein n=1 Tax=Secundilactobacillus mixtipabuli TaxID=1435342 RepID=A0A1Z5IB13_9LACO|nr:hypothetical protein [Secundilactobacillus mixtipabuli]GAW99006.1 hypothetical protein IWT30_00966 [Secundilactobacillus mixtipabuli]